MRVLFFGTPHIAVPYLDWLLENTTVVGVVCRPDEPVGRGLALTAPPTKTRALERGLSVFQPTGPWTDERVNELTALKADVGIVVAYGRILPETVFNGPRHGCVNLHFSLLPRYRGAAPMQWALINGETMTGVTAFWLEAGLDSGPIAAQSEVPIAPEDDAARLRDKLVPVGIGVLGTVIRDLSAGRIVRKPQAGEPTFAPILKKESGRIDWSRDAGDIVNLVRGVSEWPVAQTRFSVAGSAPKTLKIYAASVSWSGRGEPGHIVDVKKDQGFAVAAGAGAVLVREVQPEGKKRMGAWAFWQGARMKVGDRLG